MPGARRQGISRTAWMDNIKMWTGLSVEESIRMTEDRDKWRKYIHGVANPRIKDSQRTEQNSLVIAASPINQKAKDVSRYDCPASQLSQCSVMYQTDH